MSLLNCHLYRSAVALNNIGVELLEKGSCYTQALDTFVDATIAMKAALRSFESESADTVPDVRRMVEQANKRRSRPMPMGPSYRMLNLADEHSSILRDGSLLDVIFPIRIDDVSGDLRCPSCQHDPDVQGAIVLHNYGLANLCIARITRCQKKKDHAVFLFELANEIVGRRGTGFEDALTHRHLACVNMAILSGLLHTTVMSNTTESHWSAKDLNDQLYRLRSAVAVLDEHLDDIIQGVHLAAAA